MWAHFQLLSEHQSARDQTDPEWMELFATRISDVARQVIRKEKTLTVEDVEYLRQLYEWGSKEGTDDSVLFFRSFIELLRNLAGVSVDNRSLLIPETFNKRLVERSLTDGLEDLIGLKRFFQYLGNLVNGEDGDDELWCCILKLKEQIFELLIDEDQSLSRFVAFSLHSFSDAKKLDRLTAQPNLPKLIDNLIASVVKHENEWSLYLIEKVCGAPEITDNLLGDLGDASREFILEMFMPKLNSDNIHDGIYKSIREYCAAGVKKNVLAIRDGKFNMTDSADALNFVQMVQALVQLSAHEDFGLKNDIELLIMSLECIKCIHQCRDEGHFDRRHDYESLAGLKDDIQESPFFTIKSNFVRLIGNMCHKQRLNQDTVRELNGLELLCDMSSLDARNPYITQEVVFALRNLLEGNTENQEIVGKLRKVETTGDPLVQPMR